MNRTGTISTHRLAACVALLLAGGCSGKSAAPTCTGAQAPANLQTTFGGDRPVQVLVSKSYDPTCPTPLLLILHGYNVNGLFESAYIGAYRLVQDTPVVIAAPNGTEDSHGSLFWNATAACCDFDHTGVDDVGYLRGLIDSIEKVYNIDPNRVYVFGHSNGGFMAYRLACDMGDRLAAIVSLAGTSMPDLSSCKASPVSVLHIQGTADKTVLYDGGTDLLGYPTGPYLGAVASTDLWAAHNGCKPTRTNGPTLDLDVNLPGAETQVSTYSDCPKNGQVQLWTINGGAHVPAISENGMGPIWSWLSKQRR